MCGIAGKVSLDRPADEQLLARMCDALEHRGPDARGLHVDGGVGIGMRRLAIIDLSGGDQPLYSEDGRVALVCNGEIYNHRELRADLEARGHRFATDSDSEVVLHAWEEHGADCVKHLRGMYGFALWDAGRDVLFLGRDRVGKKPVYWTLRGDTLWFASEPRAIFQDPEVPREVDPVAVDAFLVNQYVPHHLCAFKGVSKLPPASTLLWKRGEQPRIERYWRLEHEPRLEIGMEEAAERVREMILEATRIRLMSDVPLGAFLSGGVDSSAIVAAMAQTSAVTLPTFSAVFAEQEFDERPYARMVAERYGTEHHELEIGPPGPELLPRLAWHLGEPLADPAVVPTYQLAELTRRHVTVALNGDGGDEAFGGYKRYRDVMRTRPAEALPRALRRAAARAAGDPGRRAARLAGRLAMDPPHRYGDLFSYFKAADRRALYGPALRPALAADPQAHLARAWDAHPGLGWGDRLMAVDVETYLADDLVAKVDLASMAASLEVRSPLLDQELLGFAARLPEALKVTRQEGKRVLKRAVAPWLPAELMNRPKQGFGVPVADWLRGPMREMARDLLLDPGTRERGLLDPAAVARTFAEHDAGADRRDQLWAMVNLELWLRTCVDVAPATPAGIPALA